MLPNPYPTLDVKDRLRLHSLGYPYEIIGLVYSQFEETLPRPFDAPTDIWLHWGQSYDIPTHERATGHQVLLHLLGSRNLYRAATFHDIRYYTLYPERMPSVWHHYSHIVAWKGLARNRSDEMVVPALYTKPRIPTIQWIKLSLIMHAGEATLLYEDGQGD